MQPGIVEFWPFTLGHLCGYCKLEGGSKSDGMWAHSLSVKNYQDLIDRGWRRSGKYCYKPIMRSTCCPLYTIKCNALEFTPSKSQKKILKKVSKYLKEGLAEKSKMEIQEDESTSGYISERTQLDEYVQRFSQQTHEDLDDIKVPQSKGDETQPSDAFQAQLSGSSMNPSGHISKDTNSTTRNSVSDSLFGKLGTSSSKISKQVKQGTGIDPTKPPCKKAKQIRLERKQQKLLEKGENISMITQHSLQTDNQRKSLEDYILESAEGNLTNSLELRLVPANSSPEMLNMSWQLYVKYQMTIHKETEEKCTFSNFKNFLVDSPLKHFRNEKTPSCGFGSFHHQYWLNEKLIAVGVIDILPSCISSVYFFYDPMYSFLSLGTYGALREIELARALAKSCPDILSYYMGFYIHSCPKMRYKGQFKPAFLLCPEAYTWHPIEKCIEKIEKERYSRFNIELIGTNTTSNLTREKVIILWHRKVMEYRQFVSKASPGLETQQNIQNYVNLVGLDCAKNMLLHIS